MTSQRTLELVVPSEGREEFLIFDSNRLASEFLERWPTPSHQGLERCAILCGDSGYGKSHLAEQWARRNQALPLRITSTKDLADHIFLQPQLSPPAFILDPYPDEPLSSEIEDSFFHFLNHLTAHHGSLLITSQTNPNRWQVKLPDLRSRILAMSHYRIEAAEDDLLRALAVKFFREFQIAVEPELIDYLLARTIRNPATLYQLIGKLNEEGLKQHRAVSIHLAREFLTHHPEDPLRFKPR